MNTTLRPPVRRTELLELELELQRGIQPGDQNASSPGCGGVGGAEGADGADG